MAPKDDWPGSDEMRAIIERFERTIHESELVRGHIERQLRSKPVYPDRRRPRRWDDPDERGNKG
jgi:hypothetical protein